MSVRARASPTGSKLSACFQLGPARLRMQSDRPASRRIGRVLDVNRYLGALARMGSLFGPQSSWSFAISTTRAPVPRDLAHARAGPGLRHA
jgi:hypothetical protein